MPPFEFVPKPSKRSGAPRPPKELKAAIKPAREAPIRRKTVSVKRKEVVEPQVEETVAAPEVASFSELDLAPHVLQAVSALGYEAPTPIQAQAIPVMISGRDLIGQAQTGTGKTAAFAIPLIQLIDPSENFTHALVLEPTRELAIQVAGALYNLSKGSGLRVVPVYGGQPIDRQFRALNQGAHIVVGTPGRILDHLRRGSLVLGQVKSCVLDEADEMLALGFIDDVESILAEMPEPRQISFFSATMPQRVSALIKRFLHDPVHIVIESKKRTVESTNQTYYDVPPGKKLEALGRVLDMEAPGPTIVFCRTRQETNDLAEALTLRGYSAEPLHGDMNQAERDKVMRRFRDGQADLLVATDVAARGLDIEGVTHVINFDIPWDVEQYIHRVGRTGRMGRAGDAITLVEGKERRQLRYIEQMIGAPIRPVSIPTPSDIAARRRDVFRESLREALGKGDFDTQLGTVEALAVEYDPSEIAAAALTMLWEVQNAGKSSAKDELNTGEQPEVGMVRLFVGMGRQDGLRPGDLVGSIAREADIPGKSIGAIDILDRMAFVEVPAADADLVIDALSRTKLRGRRVKVNRDVQR
jgi:ATP-dependent RNA helicase DeaD